MTIVGRKETAVAQLTSAIDELERSFENPKPETGSYVANMSDVVEAIELLQFDIGMLRESPLVGASLSAIQNARKTTAHVQARLQQVKGFRIQPGQPIEQIEQQWSTQVDELVNVATQFDDHSRGLLAQIPKEPTELDNQLRSARLCSEMHLPDTFGSWPA